MDPNKTGTMNQETEGPLPFNDHPSLPLTITAGWLCFRYASDGDHIPFAPTLVFSRKHSPRPHGGPFMQDQTQITKEQSEAAESFILHAVNTYYEREQSRKEDLAKIEALTADRNHLRRFIEELVSNASWGREIRFPEDMDGGSIQDLAEQMKILVAVPHPEPCAIEGCPCEEFGPVDKLFHFAWSSAASLNIRPKS